MSRIMSYTLVLMLAGLVGCGGADTDTPVPDPAPPESTGASASSSSTPAAAPQSAPASASAPTFVHTQSSEPQMLPPDVEPAHTAKIENAWQRALAGQDPTTVCAVLKSQLGAAATAVRAVAACSVDVPVRYFHTQLERVQRGEASCAELSLLMQSKLPGMTMSPGQIRDVVRSSGESGDGTSGSASGNPSSQQAGDSQWLVKDRLYDSVVSTCPGEAAEMMQ